MAFEVTGSMRESQQDQTAPHSMQHFRESCIKKTTWPTLIRASMLLQNPCGIDVFLVTLHWALKHCNSRVSHDAKNQDPKQKSCGKNPCPQFCWLSHTPLPYRGPTKTLIRKGARSIRTAVCIGWTQDLDCPDRLPIVESKERLSSLIYTPVD